VEKRKGQDKNLVRTGYSGVQIKIEFPADELKFDCAILQ
jgi:hypothetical protein